MRWKHFLTPKDNFSGIRASMLRATCAETTVVLQSYAGKLFFFCFFLRNSPILFEDRFKTLRHVIIFWTSSHTWFDNVLLFGNLAGSRKCVVNRKKMFMLKTANSTLFNYDSLDQEFLLIFLKTWLSLLQMTSKVHIMSLFFKVYNMPNEKW